MTTALRAARIFDGDRFVDDRVVVINGSTITRLAARGDVDAPIEDLGDVTLLPGLVDAHQHLVFDGRGTLEEQVVDRTDDELRERARQNAQRALRAGITTIRDLGDRGFVTLDLRDDPCLPTILASGPPITADGGHCWFLGGGCADTDALLAAVAERRRRGCDVVKVMTTGGALTPTFPMWASQFDDEQVSIVVEAAHAAGMPVAAHCHGVGGIRQALDARVDTIEHCSFFTDAGHSEYDDALLDRVARSGIPVSATLGVRPDGVPPPVVAANLQRIKDAVREVHRRGGTVVAGTDAGVGPAKPHDVLPFAASDLAALGLDNAGVLATMTARAARVCGVGTRKGHLAAGHDADVLAVGGDPSSDLDALFDVRHVWRGGRAVV